MDDRRILGAPHDARAVGRDGDGASGAGPTVEGRPGRSSIVRRRRVAGRRVAGGPRTHDERRIELRVVEARRGAKRGIGEDAGGNHREIVVTETAEVPESAE